ncbi:MAG: thiamine pyrophosphate-binding protein [Proteobacteria bacterium]|nr:thiamine pyrophosphate-binding protein [Pseudomonadota bacterium]
MSGDGLRTLTGRSAFLELLEDEGVSHLFGNPGTTELPIMDALVEHPDMRYVLGLQESIVVAMADGYSRASGRLSACNVHVAPGLGNALGSLYNAAWYGSPVIVTAGQQQLGFGLTEPLLSGPLVAMATPLVKWAAEVTRLADLPLIFRRAAKIALTPPTGPVFVSLPGDILNDEMPLAMGQSTRVETAVLPAQASLHELADSMLAASNPVIVSGHEIATGDALDEAESLAELLGAPVYQQTVPYAVHFRSEHPAFMGSLGRDQPRVREILEAHDLMICLGADVLRMSVWHRVEPMPPGMKVIQIGQRDWEFGKNYPAEIAVRADVGQTLRALAPVLEGRRSGKRAEESTTRLATLAEDNWSARRAQLREQTLGLAASSPIRPERIMLQIAETLPEDAVVVEEALISARSLLSFLSLRDTRGFYGRASGGIGFAIAGAIGIQLAQPHRPLVAIIGDGSAMYSIQALWTAAHLDLPITYIICNNRSYRILKERLLAFKGMAATNQSFTGMDFHDPPIDFVALAQSMGVKAQRITELDAFAPALQTALAHAGPDLLDVVVHDGFQD